MGGPPNRSALRLAVDRFEPSTKRPGFSGGMPLEIGAWLEGLGLAEYAPAFREHQITADVLGDLSDDDLKVIGITTLGARKRLLRAIAALPLGAQDLSPRPAV